MINESLSIYNCINFKLSRTQKYVHQFFREELNKFDITPAQYMVLCSLWEAKGQTSPTEIGEAVMLDASTIVGLLDRLEEKGLLIRTASQTDRRALIILLTNKGWALRKDVMKVIDNTNEAVLKRLTVEEREQLTNFLEKLINNNI